MNVLRRNNIFGALPHNFSRVRIAQIHPISVYNKKNPAQRDFHALRARLQFEAGENVVGAIVYFHARELRCCRVDWRGGCRHFLNILRVLISRSSAKETQTTKKTCRFPFCRRRSMPLLCTARTHAYFSRELKLPLCFFVSSFRF